MRRDRLMAADFHHGLLEGGGTGRTNCRRSNHFAVIYQENHSFDNLYGGWEGVRGLRDADPAHTVQVSQAAQPYECLLQDDEPAVPPPEDDGVRPVRGIERQAMEGFSRVEERRGDGTGRVSQCNDPAHPGLAHPFIGAIVACLLLRRATRGSGALIVSAAFFGLLIRRVSPLDAAEHVVDLCPASGCPTPSVRPPLTPDAWAIPHQKFSQARPVVWHGECCVPKVASLRETEMEEALAVPSIEPHDCPIEFA